MRIFDSLKNVPQRNKALKLLAFLVSAATTFEAPATAPAGFAFIPEKDAAVLAKSEPTFFSVDAATKDPSGNVKVVPLQPAIDAQGVIVGAAASAASSTPAAPIQFELQTGIALPEIKRGGNKADIYPFDKMEVGMSFFVPATEAKPTPAKSLASTVSSATKRYKSETPARKFTVRAAVAGVNGETANGARVWRTV